MPQYEDVYDPPVLDSTFAEKIDELKDALAPPIPDFVSDAFSVSRAYAVGEYCIYENHFYKFTSAKSAGAWDSTKVQETTLAAEQSSTNSNLAQKEFSFTATNTSGISDCAIDTQRNYTQNGVAYVAVTLHSGSNVNDINLTLPNNITFKQNGNIGIGGKGARWSVTAIQYVYVSSNVLALNNITANTYYHIIMALPCNVTS